MRPRPKTILVGRWNSNFKLGMKAPAAAAGALVYLAASAFTILVLWAPLVVWMR